MKSIMTIDIEDWFHILDIPSSPDISEWNDLPSLVEKNFMRLLDLLSERDVKATCFVLAWVAQRFPGLIKEAVGRGHEIASHGCSHGLVYEMGEDKFFEDVQRSKAIIEDITLMPVLGYRAPGFSVTKETPWFFDKLIEAGYRYDSSIFPAERGHGGMLTDHHAPYVIKAGAGEIIEFPVSIAKILGRSLCFFGGGYLRIFPYTIIKKMATKVLGEERPVIFYIHPREIDPTHPRLAMTRKRSFKTYVNLKSTEKKIKRIVRDFNFTTMKDFIHNHENLYRRAAGANQRRLKVL